MSKIYLSGPITGKDPEETKRKFAKYAVHLILSGHKVVNPSLSLSKDYLSNIIKDLKDLSKCDAIVMLPGWRKSHGCQIEYHMALALKKRIIK